MAGFGTGMAGIVGLNLGQLHRFALALNWTESGSGLHWTGGTASGSGSGTAGTGTGFATEFELDLGRCGSSLDWLVLGLIVEATDWCSNQLSLAPPNTQAAQGT